MHGGSLTREFSQRALQRPKLGAERTIETYSHPKVQRCDRIKIGQQPSWPRRTLERLSGTDGAAMPRRGGRLRPQPLLRGLCFRMLSSVGENGFVASVENTA